MRNGQSKMSADMTTRRGAMLAGAALLGLAGTSYAAEITYTWQGATSGNQVWNLGSNWNPATVPNADGALVVISDTITGDRTITTPSSLLTLTRLTWTRQAGASGVDTLKLGGDVYMNDNGNVAANRQNYFNITNAAAASNMVVDLNGHTLTMKLGNGAKTLLDSKITLLSSATGGKVVSRAFAAMNADVVIGAGVTVRTEGTTGVGSLIGGTWHATSVLQIANANSDLTEQVTLRGSGGSWGTGPGSLIIGDSSLANPTRALFQFENPRVQGDVTISTTTTANSYSNIGWRGTREMYVGGNFTDYATGNLDYFYHADAGSRGTIVFNGGITNERTLTISRTGLTKTGFRVGNTIAEKGNVKLGADLTTQDGFTVKDGSRFNLADKTLTTGSFTGEAGATLAFTFGDADTGLVNVTGTNALTLGNFTLDLALSGTWTGSKKLVLFTYVGDQIVAPTITLGNVPTGFSYGQVKTDGGEVYLTTAAIPEPAGLGLLTLGGLLSLRRRKR